MEPGHKHANLDRQPSLIRGGEALLFERLCMDSEEPASSEVQDLQALAGSVLRELRFLLNTRLAVGVGRSDESSQTVVNYGLPDFSGLNAASPADREKLASLMETKIAAFEPRLREVRVMLEPDPSSPCNLIGSMSGLLRIASISEPVTFPVAMGNAGVLVLEADYAGR